MSDGLRHVRRRVGFPTFLGAAILGVALAATAACSLLLDTSNNQCDSDQDCTNRGAGFSGLSCQNHVCVSPTNDAGGDVANDVSQPVEAGPWSCLGNVEFPDAAAATVNVIVPLVDLSTQMPVTSADVFARVCAKIDVNCNNPLATTAPDANGLLHLTLASGFDGFVLVFPILPSSDAGADAEAGDGAPPNVFVPSIVFFNPPIEKDLTYSTIVMVKSSDLQGIAAIEGTTIDPSLGAIFMETVDCNASPAAGVSVTLDSTGTTTQGFYFDKGLPVLNAPSTDVSGYAGFVNVPLGTRTVTGKLEATKQNIGTATVFTRQSMISYTVMAPTP